MTSDRKNDHGKLVLLASTPYLDGWGVPWYVRLRALHYFCPALRGLFKVLEGEPFGIQNERLRAVVKKRFQRGDSFHYDYGWVPLQSIW